MEKEAAQDCLDAIRGHELGKMAQVIGEVREKGQHDMPLVLLRTRIGGLRIVPVLAGEPLPRIC